MIITASRSGLQFDKLVPASAGTRFAQPRMQRRQRYPLRQAKLRLRCRPLLVCGQDRFLLLGTIASAFCLCIRFVHPHRLSAPDARVSHGGHYTLTLNWSLRPRFCLSPHPSPQRGYPASCGTRMLVGYDVVLWVIHIPDIGRFSRIFAHARLTPCCALRVAAQATATGDLALNIVSLERIHYDVSYFQANKCLT
jgi:hypothetical protein